MLLKKWDSLSNKLKVEEVKIYYDYLSSKRLSLILKRIFDIFLSFSFLIILSPLFLVISILIKYDSPGKVFFQQKRITQYGNEFEIIKFRTMKNDNNLKWLKVTSINDSRITNVGRILRKYKLDELPQLVNVLLGEMSFVGTRPEVINYVEKYSNEMYATLLIPAGITSLASLKFKNEEEILSKYSDIEVGYLNEVLPIKMKLNLESLLTFSFRNDMNILFKTVTSFLS